MGLPRAAPFSNYILPYIIIKMNASHISNESSFTSYIQHRLYYGITCMIVAHRNILICFKGYKPYSEADNVEFRLIRRL